jgi:hypothetical protein
MRRIIVAGLLYLTGIAVVLVLKPQYMFREDGRWKEFGIGRDPKNFTYMPFWMFAIIWAIVSYVLIALLEEVLYGNEDIEPIQVRNRPNNRNRNKQKDLVPGYYMLNQESTSRNGVPRYVYVGPEEPDN